MVVDANSCGIEETGCHAETLEWDCFVEVNRISQRNLSVVKLLLKRVLGIDIQSNDTVRIQVVYNSAVISELVKRYICTGTRIPVSHYDIISVYLLIR